ncbi:hypothetical protein F2P79_010486 [Pimephales promelas]|nr:hypothetical protein F2P79_010486 [Pimephales promelas]
MSLENRSEVIPPYRIPPDPSDSQVHGGVSSLQFTSLIFYRVQIARPTNVTAPHFKRQRDSRVNAIISSSVTEWTPEVKGEECFRRERESGSQRTDVSCPIAKYCCKPLEWNSFVLLRWKKVSGVTLLLQKWLQSLHH